MVSEHGPVTIFGAGGFVGRNLVRRLELAGIEVIVPISSLGHRLDIGGRVSDIREALGRAKVVVNAAGTAHVHSRDPSTFWTSNATGAGHVAEAVASSPGVRRLVHVSSLAVGSGGLEPPATEGAPFTAYGASKAAGEIAVAAALKGSPTELVVVRPAGIGGSESPGSWGSIRRLVEAGKRVPIPDANVRYDVVEIEEVVTFLDDAIRGRVPAGVHPLIGRHPVTLTEYADLMGRLSGTPARVVRVPLWLLKAATAPVSVIQRFVAPVARIEQLVTTLTEQRPLAIQPPADPRPT